MERLVEIFRSNSELAIFLTLALGFWFGNMKLGKFSLGVVTSTLLAGVLVGQMKITISPDVKSVFFMMFLFAVGYGVGPQFFNGLKKDGLQTVAIGVVLCVACLLTTYVVAKLAGFNPGEAAGLLAGACTISAVLGVATDTVNSLPLPPGTKEAFIAGMPVAYAVTYLYGTAGSAWVLASLGPKILGINLAAECAKYEKEMGVRPDSAGVSLYTRFAVRAYKVENPALVGQTIGALENAVASERVFVVRVRQAGQIVEVKSDMMLEIDAVVAIAGRREALLAHGPTFGPEVDDRELLDFPGEVLDIVVTNKAVIGRTLNSLAEAEGGNAARGVFLRKIIRAGNEMPFVASTKIERGDVLQVAGPVRCIEQVAAWIGYADRAADKTDMIFMGIGIVLGGIAGTFTLTVAGVPLSLSASGGALIAGLICGWLRSIHRTFGRIPGPALWVFNNVGLNIFIAVVGISSGPTFIAGLKNSGLTLLLGGVAVTTIPFIITLLFGKYVMKMNPAILLGANAGGRTTTAALGALEEAAKSHVPALGYTVPYAVGNVLLITWGVIIVLMLK
ncbi:MAG TPA: aspartate-alanine antiporter [Candidatus Didemnitutus sp.]|nr:aspartate-alanine antiporter [Candidatus Didemnitutus sp.]